MTFPPGRPSCECGVPGCFPTELPRAAWAVAGHAGIGRGPDGTDLIACAEGHVPEGLTVYEDHGAWLAVGAPEPPEEAA